jgi:hypothetical protein
MLQSHATWPHISAAVDQCRRCMNMTYYKQRYIARPAHVEWEILGLRRATAAHFPWTVPICRYFHCA